MAKFQLCEFRRVAPTAPLKSDPANKWERGLACVTSFGMHDVEYIIDDEGDKVKTLHDYRLMVGYGPVALDTEEPSAFYPRSSY